MVRQMPVTITRDHIVTRVVYPILAFIIVCLILILGFKMDKDTVLLIAGICTSLIIINNILLLTR